MGAWTREDGEEKAKWDKEEGREDEEEDVEWDKGMGMKAEEGI